MNLKWYRFCQHSPCATSAASSLLPEHSWPPESAQVHAMQHKHNAKIKFLVEIKSALQQRAITTKAEILRHLLSPRLTSWTNLMQQGEKNITRRKYQRPNTSSLFQAKCTLSISLCPSTCPPQKLHLHQPPHHWFKKSPKCVHFTTCQLFLEMSHSLHSPTTVPCHLFLLLKIITHVINTFSTETISRKITATCRSTRKHG